MAWTSPTTRATGDLISASIWNTDLVNNLHFLGDAPSWVTPTLGNSFTGVAGRLPQYALVGNRVFLRGSYTPGGANGGVPFTLPSGFRPPQIVNLPLVFEGGSTSFVGLSVQTSGNVALNFGVAAAVSQDGCAFFIN